MAGFPTFKLYESDGITLVYEFDNVTEINDFQDPANFVEHTSLRGQGSIIAGGDEAPWDLVLTFVLFDDNYQGLSNQLNNLLSTIDKFTKYILSVEYGESGDTKDYKVQRITPIEFPLNNNKKRVNIQKCQITLRVNTWN
jgi:hypothetical protein